MTHTVDYDIDQALRLYRQDPADSDYQRGFLAALLQVFNIDDADLKAQLQRFGIRLVVEFEAIDENTCKVLEGARAEAIAQDTRDIIRQRLVGEGFLPEDVTLGQFEIRL